MRRFGVLLLCVALCFVAGCSPADGTSGAKPTVKVAGSTSVAPLLKQLKTEYEARADVAIEIQETGSSAGITATLGGAADIAMSSRDLSGEEEAAGLLATEIALDAIVVIVHPDNPVEGLPGERVRALFSGEAANWSDVGGEDREVIVVSREDGSGTRDAFETLLGLEEDLERDGKPGKRSLISQDALYENSTGAVKADVTSARGALGYISLGALDDSVRALAIDGAYPTGETVKDGSYPLARPFLLCTRGEPEGEAADFIAFILSEAGQAIVRESGYVVIG